MSLCYKCSQILQLKSMKVMPFLVQYIIEGCVIILAFLLAFRNIAPIHPKKRQILSGKTWLKHLEAAHNNESKIMMCLLESFSKIWSFLEKTDTRQSILFVFRPKVLSAQPDSHTLFFILIISEYKLAFTGG